MKDFFYKYEWYFILLGFVFVATFVPMLISAKSWLAFGAGVVYLVAYIVWFIAKLCDVDELR